MGLSGVGGSGAGEAAAWWWKQQRNVGGCRGAGDGGEEFMKWGNLKIVEGGA